MVKVIGQLKQAGLDDPGIGLKPFNQTLIHTKKLKTIRFLRPPREAVEVIVLFCVDIQSCPG